MPLDEDTQTAIEEAVAKGIEKRERERADRERSGMELLRDYYGSEEADQATDKALKKARKPREAVPGQSGEAQTP